MSRWCSRVGGTYHYQQKHNKDSSAEPVPGDLPLLSPGEGCSTHCEAEKKERTLIKQLERKGKARGVRKETRMYFFEFSLISCEHKKFCKM